MAHRYHAIFICLLDSLFFTQIASTTQICSVKRAFDLGCTCNTPMPPKPILPAHAANAKTLRSLCVFCGSQYGRTPHYGVLATALAQQMVARKIRLVFGGGGVGIMGTLSQTMLDLGGEVIGVTVKSLVDMEQTNHHLKELIIAPNLEERKLRMYALCDAFLTLPGGVGTFDELFGVLTGEVVKAHQKPSAVLDAQQYYAPLWAFLNHASAQGFVKAKHLALLPRFTNPVAALNNLSQRVMEYGESFATS